MNIDIGRVFSTSWDILKERFWLLVAMLLVYFVIQMVAGSLLGGVMTIGGLALGAGAGTMDDPAAMMGGLGIGFMLLIIMFYVGIIVLSFAQMGSMAAQSTPLYRLQFGEALAAGFKSVLTFLGLTIALIVAYFVFVLGAAIIAVLGGLLGETVGTAILALLVLATIPALIYVSLRLSVIIQVVAVDKVYNPIEAIKKCWAITKGNVLGIFVVYLVFAIAAFVLIGIPLMLMFGSIFAGMGAMDGAGSGAAAAASMGFAMLGMLILVPIFMLYSILQAVVITCLHAEMSDTNEKTLEETFG